SNPDSRRPRLSGRGGRLAQIRQGSDGGTAGASLTRATDSIRLPRLSCNRLPLQLAECDVFVVRLSKPFRELDLRSFDTLVTVPVDRALVRTLAENGEVFPGNEQSMLDRKSVV